MKESNFYRDLPTTYVDLPEIFRRNLFYEIPPDWHVIIADVKNSTAAVNAGDHDNVNLVAASSLIVSLNIAREAGLQIPFFFTGDGGTVLVPQSLLPQILTGLEIHQSNSLRNFGLALHVGHLPLAAIGQAGHFLKIAKVQFGRNFTKPVIIGDGLKYAEQVIKQLPAVPNETGANPASLNMEGLECRWDKVKPPAEENEVACYIIEAADPWQQLEVYGQVLARLEEIYGGLEDRNPLSLERLKLKLSVNKIKKEMMTRFGRWKRNYLMATLLKTFIGRLYFKYNWKINSLRGKEYLRQVVTNADTLTIDGRINTIISGTREKRLRFDSFLREQEEGGRLLFGHFISRESIMTCYIENRNENHIHFVDGADGGYTEAAKELKRKYGSGPVL